MLRLSVFAVFGSNALTVNNSITGSYALTKAGNGDLTLAAPSTFSGPTTINATTAISTSSMKPISNICCTRHQGEWSGKNA